MRVLVVNVGSSSLKLRFLGAHDEILFSHEQSHRGDIDPDQMWTAIGGFADQIEAVGHRVVHGGRRFMSAVLVDSIVQRELRALTDLAPLHQAACLSGIEALRSLLPDIPSVACFDTSFHTTMPAAATTYAVPVEWRERYGVRRYGFHGLSHAYTSRHAARLDGRPLSRLRTVTCHLGAGASLAAVQHGVSVDTTMGFTPLDGLVMATRSGSIDPGLVAWLVRHTNMTVDDVSKALEHDSGLLALAGSPDMAVIEAAASKGDGRSLLAIDVFVHRLRAGIASMASAMSGLDVLAFTGGVGENSPTIRSQTVGGLGFLGVEIDEMANTTLEPDADLSAPGSAVRTLVVKAREDIQIATEVREVITPSSPKTGSRAYHQGG